MYFPPKVGKKLPRGVAAAVLGQGPQYFQAFKCLSSSSVSSEHHGLTTPWSEHAVFRTPLYQNGITQGSPSTVQGLTAVVAVVVEVAVKLEHVS